MKVFGNTCVFVVLMFTLNATAMAAEGCKSAAASCIPSAWWIAPVGSVVALIIAYIFYKRMMTAPEGNEKMVAIAVFRRAESVCAGGVFDGWLL